MNHLELFKRNEYFILDMSISSEMDCISVGDSVLLSGLPKILKTNPFFKFDKVYVRLNNLPNEDNYTFINKLFKNNIYVDGLISCPYNRIYFEFVHRYLGDYNYPLNKSGLSCFTHFLGINPNFDEFDFEFPLPEDAPLISNRRILDVNSNSQAVFPIWFYYDYLVRNEIYLDYQIQLNFKKEHIMPMGNLPIIEVNTPEEYYSILYHNEIHCSFSGQSVILQAWKKKFYCYFLSDEFQHIHWRDFGNRWKFN